jgi:hypothetical protein
MSIDDIARAVAESALSVEERLGFLDLCEARSVAELLADRQRVRSYQRVIEHGVESGSALEEELAQPIADTLVALLETAADRSFVERRVLAGAVEYFLRTDDTDGDFGSDHGLTDDARVVLAVSDALGRQDLVDNLASVLG